MGCYIVLLLASVYNLGLIIYSQEHLSCYVGPYWGLIVILGVTLVLYPLCEIICLAKDKIKNNKEKKMKDWKGDGNSIYKTIGASNHTKEDRAENDYYATDPIAIDKLLKVEKPSKYIWECACGEGHLAKRLKEYGFEVLSSDIIERNYEIDFIEDFLKEEGCCHYNWDILTNPPYKYAKEFVLQALKRVCDGSKVYMFLKLTFLEGKSRFSELFSKYPPKNIYVFSERVACAKNGQFEKLKELGGSAVAYAWFVWEKGFQGKTTIDWI